MLGKLIKIIRTEKGLTQKELADRLNIAQTTLSGYETGYSNPTFIAIQNLVEKCGFEIVFRDKITSTEYTFGARGIIYDVPPGTKGAFQTPFGVCEEANI